MHTVHMLLCVMHVGVLLCIQCLYPNIIHILRHILTVQTASLHCFSPATPQLNTAALDTRALSVGQFTTIKLFTPSRLSYLIRSFCLNVCVFMVLFLYVCHSLSLSACIALYTRPLWILSPWIHIYLSYLSLRYCNLFSLCLSLKAYFSGSVGDIVQ